MGDAVDPQVHKIVTNNGRRNFCNLTEPLRLGRNIATQTRYRHGCVDGMDLCDDILFDILTRVPARILHLSMRCVSKKWFRMITDPVFVDAHLKLTRSGMLIDNNDIFRRGQHSKVTMVGHDRRVQYQFASGEIVLGSCNGLLLLLGLNAAEENRYIDGRVTVFNPATGWHSALRPLPVHSNSFIRATEVRGGIGFDPVTQQYKVVVFFRHRDQEGWNCNVLTVGYGHWRMVHGLPNSLRLYSYSYPSVLINSSRLNLLVNVQDPLIVTLDIASWDQKCRRPIEFNEIFRPIELNEEMMTGSLIGSLVEMRGFLAISLFSRDYDIVIWVVDEDKIWTKRVVLQYYAQASWPIGILQTSQSSTCNEEVLVIIGYEHTLRGIPYSTKDAKRVKVNDLTDFIFIDDAIHLGWYSACAHVDSLVSLSGTNY